MEVVSFGNEPEATSAQTGVLQTRSGRSAAESLVEQPVTFVLHGFPGIRSRQNREIAEVIARETGGVVHLFLYTGLGCAPGTFSFQRCVDEVRDYFEEYFESNPAQAVRLVGHSWGGFLSLLITNEFPAHIRRLVLMSPLLKFFDETTMSSGLKEYSIQYPFLDMSEPHELARDFVRVGNSYPSEKLIAGVPEETDVLFLQAKVDEITPGSVAEALLPSFRRAPEYRIADNDHSFLSNREALAKEISAFLMR